jgi:hypothetical protein
MGALAVSEWDRALDDAEATYADAVEDFRQQWLRTGLWEQSWRMWAALTPGLTERDVLDAGGYIVSCRSLCDWTPAEVARVQVALLDGYLTRLR